MGSAILYLNELSVRSGLGPFRGLLTSESRSPRVLSRWTLRGQRTRRANLEVPWRPGLGLGLFVLLVSRDYHCLGIFESCFEVTGCHAPPPLSGLLSFGPTTNMNSFGI